jgi:1-acyl-sn-glycerol-3-phosphate acyltransferase
VNRVTDTRPRLARWTSHLPGGAAALPLALPWAAWCGCVVVICVLAAALLVAVVPGEERRRHIARNAARFALALGGVRLGIVDEEAMPHGGSVVVANHASYVDGIVMAAALPASFRFVIKKEITRVPVAHFLLRRIGSEFVERFDRKRGAADVRRLFRQAGGDSALAVFPEGTFGPLPGLGPFRRTAFTVACRAGLPVVPVTIRGARRILPAGSPFPWPGRVEVVFTPALPPRPPGQAAALAHAARTAILARLDEPDLATGTDVVPE